MKAVEPQKEHHWLQRLVGQWAYEFEMPMAPGEAPTKQTGTESVRTIGGLWVQAEGHGQMPDGTPATTMLTLGYDPQKAKFAGTWFGSMMTYLWVYEGSLDETGNVLTLLTEGPNCVVEGTFAKYKEVIELTSDDYRVFTSSVLGDDGQWQQMMTIDYRRVK